MGIFDLFSRDVDPADYTAPRGIPSPDEPRTLALYKYDACPYCQRVLRVLRELPQVQVELRDTLREPGRRRELAQQTGRTQVPCLFIDQVPLFESADIVSWLRAYAVRGVPSDQGAPSEAASDAS